MCDTKSLVPFPPFLEPYVHFTSDHPEYGVDEQGRRCLRLDDCIIPAVKALWERGIPTLSCCCLHGTGFGSITLPRVMQPDEEVDPDDLIPIWRWKERAFAAEAELARLAGQISIATDAQSAATREAELVQALAGLLMDWNGALGDPVLARAYRALKSDGAPRGPTT